MRLLFVTHYFHPEVGAPQTRILEAARELHARGHEVTVLTGMPHYPDGVVPREYRRRLVRREQLDGIAVLRTAGLPAPNRGFARRLLDHASYAATAVPAGRLAGAVDAIVAETPPLFTAAAGVAIARGRRAPLVLNVADLWPESAVQLGALENRHAIRAAEAIERFAYRHAAAITVPTAGMRRILLERGQRAEKVVHLPNAVDTARFAAERATRDGAPRVVYCGTVGMAQGVGTLIEAVRSLGRRGRELELVIAGDGAERAALEEQARAAGDGRVRFAGRVPRERVPELLADSDVAVLSLRDVPLFDDAVPTKMLEYMAAGLPVVAAAAGQVAQVLGEAQAGVACRPEDPEALAAALDSVAFEPRLRERMGANGRAYAERHLSRRAFVDRLEEVIERAVAEREPERVRAVYGAYDASPAKRAAWSRENPGNQRIAADLHDAIEARLRRLGAHPADGHRLLDVGCGHGDLLAWLHARGAPAERLHGVDLVDERLAAARRALPAAAIVQADARALPFGAGTMDAVVLSTVLSSVLAPRDRAAIAAEALRVLRPGGVALVYDARLPNPANARVRAIGRRELRRLFPGCEISACSLTLLPPLARHLGAATGTAYPALARVAPLRSHLLAAVRQR
ncbi:MAG TPA: glycosyltransferase [Solirubrobacteraceae bacterium]|nr:glycosyltransferase [Solirubrobacteraceae bacterium]